MYAKFDKNPKNVRGGRTNQKKLFMNRENFGTESPCTRKEKFFCSLFLLSCFKNGSSAKFLCKKTQKRLQNRKKYAIINIEAFFERKL